MKVSTATAKASAIIEMIKAGMPQVDIDSATALLSSGQKGVLTKWIKSNMVETKPDEPKMRKAREIISQRELREKLKNAASPEDALKINERFTTAKGDMVALFRPVIMVDRNITTIQESVSAVRGDNQPATTLADGFARRKSWKGKIKGLRVRLSFQWKEDGEIIPKLDKDGNPEMDAKGKIVPDPTPMINVGNDERMSVKIAMTQYEWLSEELFRA